MVGLAQLVRASDCGPEGRRFNSCIPPQGKRAKRDYPTSSECSTAVSISVFQTEDQGSTPCTRTREKDGSLLPIFLSGVRPREIFSLHSHQSRKRGESLIF